MMEEEALTIPGNSGEVQLSGIDLKFPCLVLVQLMLGDMMKDEVVVDLGWKRWH